jgi:hypothetical protein
MLTSMALIRHLLGLDNQRLAECNEARNATSESFPKAAKPAGSRPEATQVAATSEFAKLAIFLPIYIAELID